MAKVAPRRHAASGVVQAASRAGNPNRPRGARSPASRRRSFRPPLRGQRARVSEDEQAVVPVARQHDPISFWSSARATPQKLLPASSM
jgi:hypothetical protein